MDKDKSSYGEGEGWLCPPRPPLNWVSGGGPDFGGPRSLAPARIVADPRTRRALITADTSPVTSGVLGVPPTYRQPYPLDDEHEGVEAYDNKFFTFTGDRLNANPDDDIEEGSAVADAGEWVAEAYKTIEG